MVDSLHLNCNRRMKPVSLLGLGNESQGKSMVVIFFAAMEMPGLREGVTWNHVTLPDLPKKDCTYT